MLQNVLYVRSLKTNQNLFSYKETISNKNRKSPFQKNLKLNLPLVYKDTQDAKKVKI